MMVPVHFTVDSDKNYHYSAVFDWNGIRLLTVNAEVQTLRKRAITSRYTCTAYLVMNVSLYYVRMKTSTQ